MDNTERWKIHDNDRVIILVEGTHDKDFIEKILDVHGIRHAYINIMPKGGKTELGQNLQVLVRDPLFHGIERLIILRDADSVASNHTTAANNGSDRNFVTASQRSLDSVRGHLLHAKLAAPQGHAELAAGNPAVGCFIFPDGNADGMLETLCRDALVDHPDTACINNFFACVTANRGTREFSPKAWTHAFISIQEDPDLHIGKPHKNHSPATRFFARSWSSTGTVFSSRSITVSGVAPWLAAAKVVMMRCRRTGLATARMSSVVT